MSSLNLNQQRCAGVWPNDEISYTNAYVSGFLAFITIPGNLMVFVVILKNPNGKMHTPFNWLILNLGIADLLVGLVVEPLSVFVHIREAFGLPLIYHVYLQPSYFTACTASVFSLGMLTMDRYIAITSPIKYRVTLSNKRALKSSIVIWIISIALPFLQHKIGFLWCFFVFGNASVLVTFIVLIFSFVRVHLSLRAQIREMNQIQEMSKENRDRNKHLKYEAKITRAFMLMLIVFGVCYTPSLFMIYLMNFCSICSCQAIHWFRDLSFLFVVLNSSMNPFIYALRLPNFRESLRLLFGLRSREASHAKHQTTVTTLTSSSEISAGAMMSSPPMTSSAITSVSASTMMSSPSTVANQLGDIPSTAFTNRGFSETTL